MRNKVVKSNYQLDFYSVVETASITDQWTNFQACCSGVDLSLSGGIT